MLFSDRPRTSYPNHQLREVICQLRFPTILSINTTEPADFQEMIRDAFPQYIRRQDTLPQRPGGKPGEQATVSNYHFLSADGLWKLNLTRDFIALSTIRYSSWEEFARHLDKPLAAFIKLYHPAYFQRVGLRYVNVISAGKLPGPGLQTFLSANFVSYVNNAKAAGAGAIFAPRRLPPSGIYR